MTHSRVTKEGQAMGKSSARLAELGRKRLEALGLADVKAPRMRDGMCKTCACQPGAVPNGCLQTQMDFLKSAAEGTPFLCHSPQDGSICTGWMRARAELVANPLPQEVMDLLGKWKYSPPDKPAEPTQKELHNGSSHPAHRAKGLNYPNLSPLR